MNSESTDNEVVTVAYEFYRVKEFRKFSEYLDIIDRFRNPRPKLSNEDSEEVLTALNGTWHG